MSWISLFVDKKTIVVFTDTQLYEIKVNICHIEIKLLLSFYFIIKRHFFEELKKLVLSA